MELKLNKYEQQTQYLPLILWVVFFCYAACLALVFQNVIVPQLSSIYGGGKLLANDAVYFDGVAWTLAEEIRSQGWSSWKLFVNPSAHGHVAILAALYAVFGHDPSVIIPINASMHALGGVLLFLLARELVENKKVGTYAGLIAATLFITFPSALNWYGQVHRDGYAIAGTLLTLLMWVKVINTPSDNREWLWIVLGSIIGIILVGIVRPYNLTLLLLVALGALLITISTKKNSTTVKTILKVVSFYAIVFSVLVAGIIITKDHTAQINLENEGQQLNLEQDLMLKLEQEIDLEKRQLLELRLEMERKRKQKQEQQVGGWQWQESDWLPDKLEVYISSVARVRASLIYHGKVANAQSNIDENIAPKNIIEVIQYLPRALNVALLAPFPSSWFSQLSATRLLASAEMLIYYLCLPGLLLLLLYNSKPAVWLSLYFSATYLTILGFTIANVGSLYRIRYAYLFVILMLGVLGWISFLERKGILNKIGQFLRPNNNLAIQSAFSEPAGRTKRRQTAIGSSIYVMLLTFIGFIGFFYRDILMAHIFGLGVELDGFFVALLMPMTIVTILCIPLGIAFTPVFMAAKEATKKKEIQRFISNVSTVVLAGSALACILLYVSIPYFLPHIMASNINSNLDRIHELTILALPILFFSGFVILGNAILNASGKFVISSVAQLVVPIAAILAVVLFGKQYGVQAAMIGMVIGQLINLLIIQVHIYKQGYSLTPNYTTWNYAPLVELNSQYLPLVASAFFVSVAVLVNTFLAMTLPEGAVSIFNLGNKVVLLITGLVGAGVSTVMLPYFSKLIAKDHIIEARSELSVFLLMITFLSVPVSVALFVWAPLIVEILFSDGNFGSEKMGMITRVMQYAVVQVPFFACNIFLLKFATATKHVGAILLVAILGLLINIGASLLFMKHMGVPGIALGASLSMVMSTVFLVLLLARYRHVGLLDMVVLWLNWLLFISLLMSIHFGSMSGVVVTLSAYLCLFIVYSQSLFRYYNLMKRLDN